MTTKTLTRGRREPKLVYSIHEPAGEPKAWVFVTHGYAEHSGRYREVVDAWTAKGLLVTTYDLRGHGRSEGPRGHVDSFREFLDDAAALLDALAQEPPVRGLGAPILFGHSLGGLISSHVALRDPGRFRGLALTSPFFGLGVPVSKIRLEAARLVSKLVPRLRQPSGLEGKDMTHDAQIVANYDSDPLHFGHVTVRFFTEAEKAQKELLAKAHRLSLPLFCLAAGADAVVSVDAIRKVFALAGSKNKELVVLDGLYHEVLNEIDRAAYVDRLAQRFLEWGA